MEDTLVVLEVDPNTLVSGEFEAQKAGRYGVLMLFSLSGQEIRTWDGTVVAPTHSSTMPSTASKYLTAAELEALDNGAGAFSALFIDRSDGQSNADLAREAWRQFYIRKRYVISRWRAQYAFTGRRLAVIAEGDL